MSTRAASRRARGLFALRSLRLDDRGRLAEHEGLLRRGSREEMHGPRYDPCPSSLVARAETGPVVAVKVLVKEQVVAPVRILLELPGSPKHGPPSILVLQEDAGEPARNLVRHLIKRHLTSGAGRTLDGEVVAVIHVILQQGADDQRIDGHPDRPAPVRIAAEHAGVGLRRQVRHPVLLISDAEDVGMIGVIARERAYSVGAQKLLLIEHRRQYATELDVIEDRAEPASTLTELHRVVDEGRQLRARVDEPLKAVLQFRELCEDL